jgi:hypothetical protein
VTEFCEVPVPGEYAGLEGLNCGLDGEYDGDVGDSRRPPG